MDSTAPIPDQRPRCTACIHYYITHDLKFPYGCRALHFKSARQPVQDVIEASGQACLYYQAKITPRRR